MLLLVLPSFELRDARSKLVLKKEQKKNHAHYVERYRVGQGWSLLNDQSTLQKPIPVNLRGFYIFISQSPVEAQNGSGTYKQ